MARKDERDRWSAQPIARPLARSLVRAADRSAVRCAGVLRPYASQPCLAQAGIDTPTVQVIAERLAREPPEI